MGEQRLYHVDEGHIESIDVTLIATGCSNVCGHCYASATRHLRHPMSCSDIAEIMNYLDPITSRSKETLVDVYFDVFDHGEAIDVLVFLHGNAWYGYFEVLATNGHGLATRVDYQTALPRLRDMGSTHIQLAVHGLETEHDSFVRRDGAFADLLRAAQAAHEAGIRVGWVLWASKRNLTQLGAVRDQLKSVTPCNVSVGVTTSAGYALHNEHSRVDANDRDFLRVEFGDSVLAHCKTEGEWFEEEVACPSAAEGPEEQGSLVAMDIYGNREVYYRGHRLGNLMKDGTKSLLQSWADRTQVIRERSISPRELALSYGDRTGSRLYRKPQVQKVWEQRREGLLPWPQ